MDEQGIYAQIAYPNILGFSGQNAMKSDPALRLMAMQIFNDAMGEMQESSGDRIFPMAMLPWWDFGRDSEGGGALPEMGRAGDQLEPGHPWPRSALDRRPALEPAVGGVRRQ